jgi:hypothetical protein
MKTARNSATITDKGRSEKGTATSFADE